MMNPRPTYEELEKKIKEMDQKLAMLEGRTNLEQDTGKRILKILANEWNMSGPPGIVDIKDLAKELNLSIEQIKKAIKPLYESGKLNVDQNLFAASLTPEGYDFTLR